MLTKVCEISQSLTIQQSAGKLLLSGNYGFSHENIRNALGASREFCRMFIRDVESINLTPMTRPIAQKYIFENPEKFSARIVFENHDTVRRLHEVTTSSVQTVRFPLTYYTENPKAFRRAFNQERLEEYVLMQNARREKKPYRARPLHAWECMKLLSEEGRQVLFAHDTDVLQQGLNARNIHDVPIEWVKVTLPESAFPYFLSTRELNRMTQRDQSVRSAWRYIRRCGFARHEINISVLTIDGVKLNKGGKIIRYTPGLLLGDERHFPDFILGATVLMTATRAQELLGDAFGNRWMWTHKDILNPESGVAKWYYQALKCLETDVPEFMSVANKDLTSFMR